MLKNGKIEESILDFFVVCPKVLQFITSMTIDNQRKYVLTNYKQMRTGGKSTDTDHVTMFMDVNLKLICNKPERFETYNYKHKTSQLLFKDITTNTSEFTNCFESSDPLHIQVLNWKKCLNKHIHMSFTKTRIRKKKSEHTKAGLLIDERNEKK